MAPNRLKTIRSVLKVIAFVLLLLNGVAAIFGGGNLIMDPDGSSLSISPELLQYSPFHSFLIPGVVLFVVNGCFSILVLVLIAFGIRRYPLYILIEGALLTGWIIIQVIMLRLVEGLHILMGSVGITLMLCGWALGRIKNTIKEEGHYYFETPSLP